MQSAKPVNTMGCAKTNSGDCNKSIDSIRSIQREKMERPSVDGCGESKVMVMGGACYFGLPYKVNGVGF